MEIWKRRIANPGPVLWELLEIRHWQTGGGMLQPASASTWSGINVSELE
jgi:hypothetical protein